MTQIDPAGGPSSEGPRREGPPLDAVRPWPGLDAFSEALQAYFFGRDAEADDLFHRIRRDTVTLLFGQSGLGKTSLLRAGVFPRLRGAGFLPILVRLDYAEGSPSPSAQVKAALEREAVLGAEATPIGAEENLWSYFHRADRTLLGRDGAPIVPVLAFDQFEEMFTLGLAREESRAATQNFLGELAELIENRPPESFEKAIETDPEIIDNYRFDRQDYRILIALREDFLAQLESLRVRAPSIGRNRFRLRRMTGRQGFEAVTRPVPGLIEPESAHEIVRFVGRANPEDAFGAAPGESGDGLEVEPALLSLVCRALNERRLELGREQITPDLFAVNRDTIIRSFYETALADQSPALREWVEDRLLSDSGFRESVTLDGARRVLAASGVPQGALDTLVHRRLLRIEERLDVTRVEIIHDVLVPIIRDSRDSRHLRQAEAAAAERERELRRARRRTSFAYAAVAMMALLLVAAAGLGLWAYHSSQLAQRNLNAAIATADFLVKTVAERLRPLAGVQAQTVRGILGDAEKTFDQLAEIAPDSPDLRWRRAEMLIDFVEIYRDLGDTAEALRRAEAGRAIMLALAARDPANDRWQLDLAISHRTVGDALCQSDADCYNNITAALVEYGLDLAIAQRQAAAHPGDTRWQHELALAHVRIGQALYGERDFDNALIAYHAARAIETALLAKDSSDTEWQSELETCDGNIGDVYQAQNKLDAALHAYRDQQAIATKLALQTPGNTEWQTGLAVSEDKIGDVLMNESQFDGALADFRASLAIKRTLALKDPGNTGWQSDLTYSDDRIGDVLKAKGQLDAALAAYREGLAISTALAVKDPGNTGCQDDLAYTNERIGDALEAQGKLAAALAAYRASLAIRKALVLKDPGNTGRQNNLATTDDKVGGMLKKLGQFDAASAAYRDGMAIRKALSLKNPGNTEWQRGLSLSSEDIGDVLEAQGRHDAALALYRDSLATMKALALKDPGNTLWQSDLAVDDDKVGDVLVVQGQRDAALTAYRDGIAIKKALVLKAPGNTEWQSDLAVSDERIADVLKAQGQFDAALALYRDEQAISKALALKAPGNAEWQRALALSDERIGDVLVAQDKRDAALAAYRDGLAIMQVPALGASGDTIEWQLDLVISLVHVANVGGDTKANLAAALAILQRLEAAGTLPAPNQPWIAQVQEMLAKAP